MSDYATLREQLGAAYELLAQYVPPENEEVPAVSGTGSVGSVLTCTMGTWKYMGQGGTYSYAWSNGAAIGTDANTYTVAAGDAGTSINCTVTATNANGSAAAPPSNSIAIAGAVEEEAPQRAREEPHRARGQHEEAPHRARQHEEEPHHRAKK